MVQISKNEGFLNILPEENVKQQVEDTLITEL